MQTLQIRLPKKLLDSIEKLVESNIYQSRSDVIRDAVRRLVIRQNILPQQDKKKEEILEDKQDHYIH
ncbi:ribbon-helix-helix protein, CopG family [Candidatus Woesearchaeota archaeon]|nr:ribbon-helix-helix protein, CopG family [Candidatus Woesearchaeota archaeon]